MCRRSLNRRWTSKKGRILDRDWGRGKRRKRKKKGKQKSGKGEEGIWETWLDRGALWESATETNSNERNVVEFSASFLFRGGSPRVLYLSWLRSLGPTTILHHGEWLSRLRWRLCSRIGEFFLDTCFLLSFSSTLLSSFFLVTCKF